MNKNSFEFGDKKLEKEKFKDWMTGIFCCIVQHCRYNGASQDTLTREVVGVIGDLYTSIDDAPNNLKKEYIEFNISRLKNKIDLLCDSLGIEN